MAAAFHFIGGTIFYSRAIKVHHYPFHISDFNNATRHLSRIERSIYRDLIDLYYHTESALTSDINQICRLIIASSEQERTAVEQVLNEFFTRQDDGLFYHHYCEQVIAKYHEQSKNQSKAGKASAKARALKAAKIKASEQLLNGRSTGVQQVFNQPEPITINQEPITIEKKARSQFIKPNMVDIENHLLTKGLNFEQAKNEGIKFFNYYESNGWKVGKNKMVNWKSALSGWLSRSKDYERSKRNESGEIDWDSTGWSEGINIGRS